MKRNGEAGFTLIEVLISLALFAVIAGAGVSILNQILRTQSLTEARLDRLTALQRTMHLVRQDLAFSAPETLTGNSLSLAFTKSAESGPLLITYRADTGQFARITGTTETPQILLTEVASIQWRYLDGSGVWLESWPPSGESDPPPLHAVAMTLTLADRAQDLRRIIAVPQATSP
jgi:general secretion pathway protein J